MDYETYTKNYANKIIEELAKLGHDYSDKFNEICDLWEGEYGLYQGNDTAQTDFDNKPNLILYQEDHFDQHMYEDDKPSKDAYICYAGGYLYFV